MAKSYASTVIDASAEDVWARIRDFNGLATWHGGMVATSEIEDGKRRRPGRRHPQLHAHRRHAHPRAAPLALGSRALVHVRLPEDAVRRRQLPRRPSASPRSPTAGRPSSSGGRRSTATATSRRTGSSSSRTRSSRAASTRSRPTSRAERGRGLAPTSPGPSGRSTSRKNNLCAGCSSHPGTSYVPCGFLWQGMADTSSRSRRRPPASLSSRPAPSRPWATWRVPTACSSPCPTAGRRSLPRPDTRTDPRTLLVIGTDGVKAITSDCQVSSYRVPADGAAVVVIGWRDSVGASYLPLSAMKLRRGTFECFAGRGAVGRITRRDRDFQVNVLVGDRASDATVATALDAARSLGVSSRIG